MKKKTHIFVAASNKVLKVCTVAMFKMITVSTISSLNVWNLKFAINQDLPSIISQVLTYRITVCRMLGILQIKDSNNHLFLTIFKCVS